MLKIITYKSFGKKAILIEWQPIINEEIVHDILSFKYKILANSTAFYVDLIVGYHSLTITYLNEIKDFEQEVKKLKAIYLSNLKTIKQTNYVWEIPVCYDAEFGIDLEEMSLKLKLTSDEIISLHTEQLYTVFFIGFLPGFLYLGGLNKQIYFDRKPNPRLKVTKGSVAIGGQQTGVYPTDSAGGWNIIGKTPIHFFDVNTTSPCFAKAGDKIKFKVISLQEFYQIKKEIHLKKHRISKTILDD